MSDFRGRLFQERDELLRRIKKLKAFILDEAFDALPAIERSDLRKQLGHMEDYAAILEQRVARQCNSA